LAAQLVGHDADSADLWTRAHHEFLSRAGVRGPRGARSGWPSTSLIQGEPERGAGWVAGRRLIRAARRRGQPR
jgi:hypothetical protein